MTPARRARLACAVAALVAACSKASGTTSSGPPPLRLPPPMAASAKADAERDARASAPRPTSSPGCAGTVRKVSGETRTVLGSRSFHVWTPAHYDAAHPAPLLFAFHGWSSNGRDFEKWIRVEDHVQGEAIVVYPDSDAAAWDFKGDHDLAFFDAMVAELAEAHCIDPSRIYAFGFSYGGRFTHHLGCNRSDVLRGIAVGGSDWRTKGAGACGRVPVIITHRTRDMSEVIAGGRTSAALWAGVNGCADGDRVSDAKMGCRAYVDCRAPVVFCEDSHHDSSWPDSWNHTVREPYLDLNWSWLSALP